MTKSIPLSQGKFALVDDDDFEWLSKYTWTYHTAGGYAYRTPPRPSKDRILMHREITGAIKGQEVDHKNINGLDNRKENLRFCTSSQNKANRGSHNPITGYKGVYQDKRYGRWAAYINKEGKRYSLGYYSTAKEAAEAYNKKALELYGEFSKLNE